MGTGAVIYRSMCKHKQQKQFLHRGGGGAPSSSLDVSAFSSVLCQDDPTVFVPRLGDAHPWRTDFLSVFLSLCFYCTGSVTCGRCVSDVFRPHTSSFVLYLLRTHCAEICNVFSSFWINLLVQKFYFMSNCVFFGIFHRFSYRNGNNRFVFSNRLLVTKNLKMPFKAASLLSYMCRHITGSSAEVGRWLLHAPMRRRSE